MVMWKTWLLVASVCTISACGGGSSSGPDSNQTTITPTSSPSVSPTDSPVVTSTPTSTEPTSPSTSPGVTNTPVATPAPGVSPTATPTSQLTPTPTPATSPVTTSSPTPTTSPGQDPSISQILSGTVSYDFVPHQSFGALDYDGTESRPARSVKVELLSGADEVIQTTFTNNSGAYSFEVEENTDVKVRVWAQLVLNDNASATNENIITVSDNTSSNAAYVMDGSLISTGSESSSRDFHAPSGWGGSRYTSDRVAAPFAIADSIYEAAMLIRGSDSEATFQNVEIRWSTNNAAVSGNLNAGQIGTSFYNGDAMYLLGDEDNDTDEYDRSVVQHEFGHYIEDTMSRSDSIGGSHSLSTLNDMRVSFSEGFANAFTAIASATGYYEDSHSNQQGNGFRFSVENASTGTVGFYAEKSAGGVIYDIADANNDNGDTINLGFAPIYYAMTSNEYRMSSALTSIYLFADVVKTLVSTQEAEAIDNILETTQIFGTGIFGAGETNDGGVEHILPVYRTLTPGNTINLCVNDSTGTYNGVDVRRFIILSIASPGDYTISASKTSGTNTRDPDIVLFNNGDFVDVFERSDSDFESGTASLNTGEYILEFYDYNNVGGQGTTGEACFNISATPA